MTYKAGSALLLGSLLAAGCGGDATGPAPDTAFPVEVTQVVARGGVNDEVPELAFTIKNTSTREVVSVNATVNLLQGSQIVDEGFVTYFGSLKSGQSFTETAIFLDVESHAEYGCYEYTILVADQAGRIQQQNFPKVCK